MSLIRRFGDLFTETPLQMLSIASNLSLRTVGLHIKSHNPCYKGVGLSLFTRWLPRALSQTSLTDLEEIILWVSDIPHHLTSPYRLPVELKISDIPWNESMDQLLTAPKSERPTRLVFWFCADDPVHSRVKEWVAQSLPRLHGAGNMFFGGTNDPLKSSLDLTFRRW
ncbi:hypothetical protein K439DRAFT_1619978 [Ramaria rubella]|nr:hypothetical protein K439DRAFT_1619978 [Ramaria rubella]